MHTSAYYNENDPFAAKWLRNLIAEGLIMEGEVDERSIQDVEASDLRGFTRCHFFAGIAGWDLALALARWPARAVVWTGSCPCQPFSTAGKREGFADKRHLWPAWRDLIRECRPPTVFGEQVESTDGWAWLEAVRADLEASGYAVGAACLPAAGIGAPHGRHRLWFVADSKSSGRGEGYALRRRRLPRSESTNGGRGSANSDGALGVGDTRSEGTRGNAGTTSGAEASCGLAGHPDGIIGGDFAVASSDAVGMADADKGRRRAAREPGEGYGEIGERPMGENDGPTAENASSSHWGHCDWLPCSDGKSRPVEAGTCPLATRLPGDVGRLRGYGNAIVPQVAAEFVMAYLESIGPQPWGSRFCP